MAAREGRVSYRGYHTWYRVAGDLDSGRPPLLCLHGGPGSTHNYFAPLERLADDRAIVVYDQLGCGSSDRPADVEWTLELFRGEVEAVREQLGLERVHLLGTSWGGMLALEHALNGESAGLTSLVLSSTLASAAEWQAAVKALRDAVPSDEELDKRNVYRGEERPETRRMKAERAPSVYEAMWGPNEWTVTGALRGWDVRTRLGEIDVPTLVVRGAYDLSTAEVSATLENGIPGAREVVLEESSHMPVLEETERYLEIVGAFLREADQTPRIAHEL